MKKTKKWTSKRHAVVLGILYAILAPITVLRYRVKVVRLPREQTGQCLILYNHQTAFDQFFVGMAYRKPLYYLASEDLFSNGLLSSLIRFLVAPIPIKKQTTDVKAVINCIQVAREGGTIAIAPEGNRTYSGKTEYINPSIAYLARKFKLPIAFFRIEGGYGVHPRWSDVVRRGHMRAYFSRILQPEEYADLNNEQLTELICRELYVNEATPHAAYRHPRAAEYLERAIYTCPDCGLSTLESHRDIIHCTKCGLRVRYLPNKELQGVDKPIPFRFVNDWYEHQCALVRKLDLQQYVDAPLYTDTATVSRVIVYKKKIRLIKSASICLYGDRVVFAPDTVHEMILPFSELHAVSVLGRNKLNVYHGEHLYQLKGNKRFNALKYVNLYYHYKNLSSGGSHGEFLGL